MRRYKYSLLAFILHYRTISLNTRYAVLAQLKGMSHDWKVCQIVSRRTEIKYQLDRVGQETVPRASCMVQHIVCFITFVYDGIPLGGRGNLSILLRSGSTLINYYKVRHYISALRMILVYDDREDNALI